MRFYATVGLCLLGALLDGYTGLLWGFAIGLIVDHFLSDYLASKHYQSSINQYDAHQQFIDSIAESNQPDQTLNSQQTTAHALMILTGFLARSDGQLEQDECAVAIEILLELGIQPSNMPTYFTCFEIGAAHQFDADEVLLLLLNDLDRTVDANKRLTLAKLLCRLAVSDGGLLSNQMVFLTEILSVVLPGKDAFQNLIQAAQESIKNYPPLDHLNDTLYENVQAIITRQLEDLIRRCGDVEVAIESEKQFEASLDHTKKDAFHRAKTPVERIILFDAYIGKNTANWCSEPTLKAYYALKHAIRADLYYLAKIDGKKWQDPFHKLDAAFLLDGLQAHALEDLIASYLVFFTRFEDKQNKEKNRRQSDQKTKHRSRKKSHKKVADSPKRRSTKTPIFPALELQAFSILNITPTHELTEIKRAYRKLMTEYHPDKLARLNLPEREMQFAKEKSQRAQLAYRRLKKYLTERSI